jgi:hypothetical protein
MWLYFTPAVSNHVFNALTRIRRFTAGNEGWFVI